ncbi:MAG: LamG domain-containing protein, partial [Candidatus Paceibacterota bacterium]
SKPNLPGVLSYGSNQALSPLYNTSGLVGYWNFDEGSGTIAKDTSGNGNNGTWSGSGSHYTTGKVGNWAGQFASSTGDYSTFNYISNMTSSDFSTTFWVSMKSVSNMCVLLGKVYGGIAVSIFGQKLNLGNYGAGQTSVGGSTIPLNQWVFISLTYNAATHLASAYFNGMSDGTLATPSWIYSWSNGLNSFGGAVNFWTDGNLDDVRVYNRALSASEIQALYNATK